MVRFINLLHNAVVVLLCSFLFVSVVYGIATVVFLLAIN